jgi:hypothetical protein
MDNQKIKQITAIIIAMYLTFAFIGLELNPAKWDIAGRIFFVVFSIGSIGISYTEDADKDNE